MQPSRYGNPRTCCRVCLSNSFAVPNFHGWLSCTDGRRYRFMRSHFTQACSCDGISPSIACCTRRPPAAVLCLRLSSWLSQRRGVLRKSPIWPRAHVRTSHKFVLESYLHPKIHVRSLLSISIIAMAVGKFCSRHSSPFQRCRRKVR